MRRERVTDDIFLFTSDLYGQVNASLVRTSAGAVLIGTGVEPRETDYIRRFVEERLKTTVTHVINTHYHADHTNGTCFFPQAMVIGHRLCPGLLESSGQPALRQAKAENAVFEPIEIVLPETTFDDTLMLDVGDKTFLLWATPGHTPDSIVCLVKQDQVLIGADTFMPVPYFVDGDYQALLTTLQAFAGQTYESIIPGYGEIILRGEVPEKIQSDIHYLVELKQAVHNALASDTPSAALDAIDIEACGKSRVLLNGAVETLHRQNVNHLASAQRQPQPENE
jgi:cyclase